jgi:uncharacterized protein (TIGR03118 family)
MQKFSKGKISASRATIEKLEPRQLLSAAQLGGSVTQTNLIADQASVGAPVTDPNLVNPWGVSFAPGGELWVSDNNAGLTSLYTVAGTTPPGVLQSFVIPGGGSTASNPVVGTPTGQVFTGGKGFGITNADGSRTSFDFVFVGEDGAITGWNGAPQAQIVVDNSSTPTAASGAVYKGATLNQEGTRLYAANFRAGTIEVYDQNFTQVSLGSRAFADRHIPKGYAPFNIQSIGSQLFVTYAKQNAEKHDDVAGAGHGFVDVFDENGKLERRFQHGGFLNSPWGVTVAPTSWGKIGGDIIVGQFGNGRIDVFSKSGNFRGFLDDASNHPITIDGLWDVTPDSNPADAANLYFTAGPQEETHGLFGALTFTNTPPRHHGKVVGSANTPSAGTPAAAASPPAAPAPATPTTPTAPTFPY